jgi:endoribonuclease Dicer
MMHDARSATVNAERLALVAVQHGLHAHLQHQSPCLFAQIDSFVTDIERRVAAHMSTGMNLDGAWERLLREHAFGLDSMAAPKVLSDVVEALIGAVWLDSGGQLRKAWDTASRLLAPLPQSYTEVPVNPARLLRVSFCWGLSAPVCVLGGRWHGQVCLPAA